MARKFKPQLHTKKIASAHKAQLSLAWQKRQQTENIPVMGQSLAGLPRKLKDRTRVLQERLSNSWRQQSRAKPSLTASHFTDQIMFSRNDTQGFMDKMFTEEDNTYLRHEARRIDKLGISAQHCDAVIEHGQEIAAETRKKAEAKAEKAAKADLHFSNITIVTDSGAATALLDPALRDQIELHRRLGVEKNIPKKSHLRSKKQRIDVLKKLISRYQARQSGETVPEDFNFILSSASTSLEAADSHDCNGEPLEP